MRRPRTKLRSQPEPIFTKDFLRDLLITAEILPRRRGLAEDMSQTLEQVAKKLELWREFCVINQAIAPSNAAKHKASAALQVFGEALAEIEAEDKKFLSLAERSGHCPSVVALRGRLDEIARLRVLATDMKDSDALVKFGNKDKWIEYAPSLFSEFAQVIDLAGTTKFRGGSQDGGPMARILCEVIPHLTGEHPGNDPDNKQTTRASIARKIRELRARQVIE